MRSYIGVKVVRAQPAQKDGVDGYQVIYPDEPGQAGYESWCPREVFEAYNRPCGTVKERVEQEYEALKEKYTKLCAYCEKHEVDANDLLVAQEGIMKAYMIILTKRLDGWKE
jgi:hypothetical protein